MALGTAAVVRLGTGWRTLRSGLVTARKEHTPWWACCLLSVAASSLPSSVLVMGVAAAGTSVTGILAAMRSESDD